MKISAVLLLLVVVLLIGSSAFAAAAIRCDDRAMLIDRDGNVLIESGIYTEITPLGNERFAVRIDDRFAICDERGVLLTEFIFSDIRVEAGVIIAGYNGSYAELTLDGKQITEMVYSEIVPADSETAWALRKDADQLFLVSKKGVSYAPQGEIDAIGKHSGDGLLAIRFSETMRWGYCDRSGRKVIQDIYNAADMFSNGIARVVSEGKYGVIDIHGDTVIPCEYTCLDIMDGMIICIDDRHTVTVFDAQGNEKAVYSDVINGYAAYKGAYALYSQMKVSLYSADGICLDEYPAGVRITAGIDGGLILSNGEWGTKCVWIHGAETNLWQDILPLGYSDRTAVYTGCIYNVTSARDTSIDRDVFSIDMESVRCTIIGNDGNPISDKYWESIIWLEDDRFLAEADDKWQQIDAYGNIYFEIEKQGDEPHE